MKAHSEQEMANLRKAHHPLKKGSRPMALKESHLMARWSKDRTHLARLLKLRECQRHPTKKGLAVPFVPISSNLGRIIMWEANKRAKFHRETTYHTMLGRLALLATLGSWWIHKDRDWPVINNFFNSKMIIGNTNSSNNGFTFFAKSNDRGTISTNSII